MLEDITSSWMELLKYSACSPLPISNHSTPEFHPIHTIYEAKLFCIVSNLPASGWWQNQVPKVMATTKRQSLTGDQDSQKNKNMDSFLLPFVPSNDLLPVVTNVCLMVFKIFSFPLYVFPQDHGLPSPQLFS